MKERIKRVLITIVVITIAYPASYLFARQTKLIVHRFNVMNGTYYSHEVSARLMNIGSVSFLTTVYKPFCDMETNYWIEKQPTGSPLTERHKRRFQRIYD